MYLDRRHCELEPPLYTVLCSYVTAVWTWNVSPTLWVSGFLIVSLKHNPFSHSYAVVRRKYGQQVPNQAYRHLLHSKFNKSLPLALLFLLLMLMKTIEQIRLQGISICKWKRGKVAWDGMDTNHGRLGSGQKEKQRKPIIFIDQVDSNEKITWHVKWNVCGSMLSTPW